MRTTIRALAAILFMTISTMQAQQSTAPQAPSAGQGAAPATTSAPPPGSAGIYKSDAELSVTLKKAIAAANGNQSSSPIANTDQYRINIVHREKAAGALAHEGNTGGINGATIQGGETHAVKKGDVILVPAGSAHWYKEVTTPITYLEVRFVAPK